MPGARSWRFGLAALVVAVGCAGPPSRPVVDAAARGPGDAASDTTPSSRAPDAPTKPFRPSELDGTYVGPDEAHVVVLEGLVQFIHLRYVGNNGFTFADARFSREGMFTVANNAFTVMTPAATVKGTFVRPGLIEGTWMEGRVSGTWRAERVSTEPWLDGGSLDFQPPSDAVIRFDGRVDMRDVAPPPRDAPVPPRDAGRG